MALSRLQAINMCLAGVGVGPVASEEDSGLDALTAGVVVDQVTRDVQSKAYWFNTERNWNLAPNATTGIIAVPSNVDEVLAYAASARTELTIRGSQVYDTFSHTYNLLPIVNSDDKICFVFQMSLDFTDLPALAKNYIAYRAKRLYAQDTEGDAKTTEMQSRDEIRSQSELEVMDMKQQNVNAFDSDWAREFIWTVGGQNSFPNMPNTERQP